jgi:pimeloyl-ACP methyl ester carboxylesterase
MNMRSCPPRGSSRLTDCQELLQTLWDTVSSPIPVSRKQCKNLANRDVGSLLTCICSIIFIHGLTGGSASTWTKKGVLWPKKHLGQDLPGAVIATFGYDADVVRFFEMAGSNTLSGHATSFAGAISALLDEIKASDGVLLPVYICAHSLGGLVAEKAYLESRDHEHLRTVFEQIRGIIFFGTPHRGSGSATMGLALGQLISWFRRTNTQLLRDLNPHADVLSDLADQFHTEQRQSAKLLELRYIYEELAVAVSGVGKVVEKDSAVVPGYPNGSIHADHIGMTKLIPSENSEYSQLVLHWMKGLIALSSQSAAAPKAAPTKQCQSSNEAGSNFNFGPVNAPAGTVTQGISNSGGGTANVNIGSARQPGT